MNAETLNILSEVFKKNITNSIPTILFAIVVLIIGIALSKVAKKMTAKFLNKLNIDQSILNYTTYSTYIVCIILTLMTTLSILGIPTNSIITMLGVLGIGLGLAFKTTLENLGSGFILIFFKPFKTGDYISTNGIEGIVTDMHIFSTSLNTFDNKTIIIPNSKLTLDNIINYTKQDVRRVDITFNLDYGTDMEKIEKMIKDLLKSNNKILKEHSSLVGIRKFKDFNLEILVTAWVNTDDYWDVYYFLTKEINQLFNANNINMKTTQEVSIRNHKKL